MICVLDIRIFFDNPPTYFSFLKSYVDMLFLVIKHAKEKITIQSVFQS